MTPSVIDGFDEDSGSLIFYVSPDKCKTSTTCHVSHIGVFDRVLTDEEIHGIWTGKIPHRTLWRRFANWFTRTFRRKRKDFGQVVIDLNPVCYWPLEDYPRVDGKLVVRRYDKDGWHDVEIEKGELE